MADICYSLNKLIKVHADNYIIHKQNIHQYFLFNKNKTRKFKDLQPIFK